MLDNVGQLEQRVKDLYVPASSARRDGTVFVQCEIARDEIAEARARMRARLAPLAQAVFFFVSDACLLPRIVAQWAKQWREG